MLIVFSEGEKITVRHSYHPVSSKEERKISSMEGAVSKMPGIVARNGQC